MLVTANFQLNAADFPLEYTYTQPAQAVLNRDGGPFKTADLMTMTVEELKNRTQKYPKSTVTIGPLRLLDTAICLNPVGVQSEDCLNTNPKPVPISKEDLQKIDQALQKAEDARVKIALQFQYNSSGTGQDAPISVIVQDIKHLAPVLAKHKNIIYVLSGGFIGAWGEGHNSTYGNDTPEHMKEFMDAEMTYFAPYVTLVNRLPSNILDWEPKGKTIWGIHDSHFATGLTDAHTWTPPTWARFKYTTNTLLHFGEMRSNELPFIAELGSEDSLYQEYDYFDAYCRRVHVNIMNIFWNVGYIATLPQFQNILNRIGAAIGLTHVSLDIAPIPGGTSTVSLSFINTGYSRQFVRRPMYLVLTDVSGKQLSDSLFTPIRVSTDITSITSSGGTSSVSLQVKFPAGLAPNTTYYVALWMPDPDAQLSKMYEYNYLLNNKNVPNEATGLNQLFSFSFQ